MQKLLRGPTVIITCCMVSYKRFQAGDYVLSFFIPYFTLTYT